MAGRIAEYIKVLKTDTAKHVSLYNPYTLKVAYLAEELYGKLKSGITVDQRYITPLCEHSFLTTATNTQEEQIKKILSQADVGNAEPDVFILKVFLTTVCNYQCKYCVIEQNLHSLSSGPNGYLSKDDAQIAIDEFCQLSSRSTKKEKIVFFYGGEPLLNWETLKFMIGYLREKEKCGEFNGSVELILETNGSLITEEIAQYLAKYQVEIIVSVDGPPEVHDNMRVYKGTGEGTFEDTRRGFETARKNNCVVVTSAVFHKFSSASIRDVITYLAEQLMTPSTGLDLLHVLDGKENPGNVNHDELSRAYLEAFHVAREKGLYVEHIMRRIRPFTDEKFRLRDCGACGNRIVVAPDRTYGQCEGFIHSRQFFADTGVSMEEYAKSSYFQQWKERLHVTFENCKDCIAIGVCGGGCPYNSYIEKGTIYDVDRKTCQTSIAFIDFLIWDVYDLLMLSQKDVDLYIPTPVEKRKIYKSIPYHLTLPLIQSQSKIMEA